MKKIALILIGLSASIGLFAQFTISPVFGANFSKLNVNKFKDDIEPGLRYYVGVQGKYDISSKFSTGLGLQYTVKGYNTNAVDTGFIASAWLNYFDIAPFLEFHPITHLSFSAGGSLGFNIHEEYNIIGEKDRRNLTLNKQLDISAFIGARYYFDRFFVSVQYNNSVVPISDVAYTDENGNQIGGGKEYNQNLQLGVGYNFHLKKK